VYFSAVWTEREIRTGEGDKGSKKTSFQEENKFDNCLSRSQETSQNDIAGCSNHR